MGLTGNSLTIPGQHPPSPVSNKKKARHTLKAWGGGILLPPHQPQGWTCGGGKKKKNELDPNHPPPTVPTLHMRVLNVIYKNQQLGQQ